MKRNAQQVNTPDQCMTPQHRNNRPRATISLNRSCCHMTNSKVIKTGITSEYFLFAQYEISKNIQNLNVSSTIMAFLYPKLSKNFLRYSKRIHTTTVKRFQSKYSSTKTLLKLPSLESGSFTCNTTKSRNPIKLRTQSVFKCKTTSPKQGYTTKNSKKKA